MADLDQEIQMYKNNCVIFGDLDEYVTYVCDKGIGVSVIHLNIRSIRKNWDLVQGLLDNNLSGIGIDIIVLTEIAISEHENVLYQLNGYTGVYYNRELKKGGGICVFIIDNIKFNVIGIGRNVKSGHEYIHLILNSDLTNIELIAVYRPPEFNCDVFTEELGILLGKGYTSEDTILIGDINIDVNNENCYKVTKYKNVLAEHGLEKCIYGNTREVFRNGKYTKSSIDHVYVKTNKEVIGSIIHLHVSDHYMVGITLKGNSNGRGNYRIEENKKTCNNRKVGYNEKIIRNMLKLINWENMKDGNGASSDTERLYAHIRDTFTQIYSNASYMKEDNKSKRIDRGWITLDIKKEIKIRDAAFKKWKNTPTNEDYRNVYKVIRNKVNASIKRQRNYHIRNEIEKVKGSLKETWHKVNEIIGRKGRENIDTKITKHFRSRFSWTEILNSFAEEFTQGVENIVHDCDIIVSDVKPTEVNHSMFIPKASNTEINCIISKMCHNKSPGLDNIRVKDIKNCKGEISQTLADFVNASIQEGIIPDELKIALIKPIYKQGQQSIFKNYRPIAILSTIEKILERYVSNHLNKYLKTHSLINNKQYGFQTGKSTTTLLCNFSEFVNSKLNCNKIILALFIDYSKAFDTIRHDKMLNILSDIGVRGKMLKWFENYLKDRRMLVKINNLNSNEKLSKFGVPQGSILGPTLYTIYVNSLFNSIHDCNMYMYADDTAILSVNYSLESAREKLQEGYNNILKWTHDYGLRINEKKTKLLCITTNKKDIYGIQIKSHTDVCLHSSTYMSHACNCPCIEEVKTFKYLGLTIDNRFIWNAHIENICNRLRGCLSQFYRLQNYVNYEVLIIIYYALVHSILRYGIKCYGNSAEVYLKKIEVLNKKIIKIIARKKIYQQADVINVYELTNILTVDNLYRYVLIVDNYFNLEHRIQPSNPHDVRNVVLRRPMTYNRYGDRQLKVVIPQMFNAIPNVLQLLDGIGIVKIKIKEWLMKNNNTI